MVGVEYGTFETVVSPFRRELLAHGYQMLGSVQDAEDVVQETMVRAWRAWDRYDADRASVRTWVHAILMNACRSALVSKQRRVLPSGLGSPGTDVEQALLASTEVAWFQPMPSAMLGEGTDDPAAVIVRQGHLRLAFVVALQSLPPRQRAVLILREVLRFSAAEVAEMLDVTTVAVNSSLQRARAALKASALAPTPPIRDDVSAEILERYMDAFSRADVAALRELLVEDVEMEMPPVPLWFRGRDDFVGFLARAFRMRGTDWRTVRVSSNGQAAFAAYVRSGDGYVAHSIQVLDIGAGGVTRNVVFFDRSLFVWFGLPEVVD